MIHAPDGKLRFSPSDLVSYLEGDFAAWCDRMLAERGRAHGAGSAELEWATPDEDEELDLAARKGREHEQRWLVGLREREPGLVEILWGDPCAAELTLAAMRDGAPAIYQPHLVVDGWQGHPDFLFRCPGNGCACGGHHYTPWDAKLARSAKPYFLVQLCAYADMLEADARVPAHRAGLHPRPGQRAAVRDPPLLPLLPPAQAVVRRLPGPLDPGRRARPRPRPELGPLGRRRRAAPRRVRSPEPGRRDHRAARCGGWRRSGSRRSPRWPAARPAATCPGCRTPCSSGSGSRPGFSSTPAASTSRSGGSGRRCPRSRAAGWRCCRRRRTATSSSTWRASRTRRAGWSTCSAR